MRGSARERPEQHEGYEEGRQCHDDDDKGKEKGGEARGEQEGRQGIPNGTAGERKGDAQRRKGVNGGKLHAM